MKREEWPILDVIKNPTEGKLTVVVDDKLEVTTYDTGLVYVNGHLINKKYPDFNSDFDLHRIRECVHDLARIIEEEFDDPNYPRYMNRALSSLYLIVERYLQ